MDASTSYTEVTLHVFANESGDAEADTDKDLAAERYEENIGGIPEHYRVLKLRIPTPSAITVTLPSADLLSSH
jgi:hypothetical protein